MPEKMDIFLSSLAAAFVTLAVLILVAGIVSLLIAYPFILILILALVFLVGVWYLVFLKFPNLIEDDDENKSVVRKFYD
jgi:fatty acid desaturase